MRLPYDEIGRLRHEIEALRAKLAGVEEEGTLMVGALNEAREEIEYWKKAAGYNPGLHAALCRSVAQAGAKKKT